MPAVNATGVESISRYRTAGSRPGTGIRLASSIICPIIFGLCLWTVLVLVPAGGLRAEVYGYRDAGGSIVITDVKPKGGHYEILVPGGSRKTSKEKKATPSPLPPGPVRISPEADRNFDPLIERYALQNGLSSPLVRAIIKTESNFNPRAVSPKGASGLMQLMPRTWAMYGVKNPFDPESNIRAGSTFFKEQLDVFKDVNLALAAYNAGPDAVFRYEGLPPYTETRNFVRVVNAYWDFYRKQEKAERRGRPFQPPAAAEKKKTVPAPDDSAPFFTGRVVRVVQGDTLTVMRSGLPTRVRLFGIDCPDDGQPGFEQAMDYTSRLAFDQEVRVDVISRDRWGRFIGEVLLPDRKLLNHELVLDGLARWMRDKWPGNRTYQALEQAAQSGKKGLWAGNAAD